MKKTMMFCMLLLLLVGCNSTKQKDIYIRLVCYNSQIIHRWMRLMKG
ncbi:hypothetical protein K210_09285 [Erysipelothrix rhusiopathiae SY1027]|nr:hypothetical protein K210_09285 [Erysipelothrix rhusiopathiae SY1027]